MIKPSSLAIISLSFAEYVTEPFFGSDKCGKPVIPMKLMAAICISEYYKEHCDWLPCQGFSLVNHGITSSSGGQSSLLSTTKLITLTQFARCHVNCQLERTVSVLFLLSLKNTQCLWLWFGTRHLARKIGLKIKIAPWHICCHYKSNFFALLLQKSVKFVHQWYLLASIHTDLSVPNVSQMHLHNALCTFNPLETKMATIQMTSCHLSLSHVIVTRHVSLSHVIITRHYHMSLSYPINRCSVLRWAGHSHTQIRCRIRLPHGLTGTHPSLPLRLDLHHRHQTIQSVHHCAQLRGLHLRAILRYRLRAADGRG